MERTVFNILKHVLAGGLALPKVNQFKLTQDGQGAWKKLNEDFYAKGNVQESIRSYYDLLTLGTP